MCDCTGHADEESFSFVAALDAGVLASLVHELHFNCGVDSPLHVDHVGVGVVGPSQDHGRAGGHLQVEFVENALGLVDVAEVLVEVVRDIEGLHRALVVAHVPNLD